MLGTIIFVGFYLLIAIMSMVLMEHDVYPPIPPPWRGIYGLFWPIVFCVVGLTTIYRAIKDFARHFIPEEDKEEDDEEDPFDA